MIKALHETYTWQRNRSEFELKLDTPHNTCLLHVVLCENFWEESLCLKKDLTEAKITNINIPDISRSPGRHSFVPFLFNAFFVKTRSSSSNANISEGLWSLQNHKMTITVHVWLTAYKISLWLIFQMDIYSVWLSFGGKHESWWHMNIITGIWFWNE